MNDWINIDINFPVLGVRYLHYMKLIPLIASGLNFFWNDNRINTLSNAAQNGYKKDAVK